MWIGGIDQSRIHNAETVSATPEKLATNLLLALFTLPELAGGNCTAPKRADIQLLNQKKIRGIRCKCFTKPLCVPY